MDLNELLIFARVAEAHSFTAAAKTLRMPKSTVSRKIAELEARVGAQLIQRTTRKLRLTEVGEAYYGHCARVVAEAEAAEAAVTKLQSSVHGLLRVTTPVNFGFLGLISGEFLSAYPDVQLEMTCTDRQVDLVEEGYDLAVRAGPLADSALKARRLGTIDSYVVAAPAYVERRGAPASPAELKEHDCLVFNGGRSGRGWTLQSGSRSLEVPVRARLKVNEFDMLHGVVRAGSGIALLESSFCVDDLAEGRLVRILPGWTSPGTPVHALYPASRHLSPKVSAFLDFLKERWPRLAPGRGSARSSTPPRR